MLWQSRAKRTYATMPEHKSSLPPGRLGHSYDDTTASTSGGTGNNYNRDWTTEAHHAGKARTACTKISSKHARLYKKDTPSRGGGGTPTETGRQAHSLGICEQKWTSAFSTSTGKTLQQNNMDTNGAERQYRNSGKSATAPGQRGMRNFTEKNTQISANWHKMKVSGEYTCLKVKYAPEINTFLAQS